MDCLNKQLRIDAGTDIERALRCLSDYIDSENAKRIGRASLSIYTNGTAIAVVIYTTPTAYIIRKAE
jgi:hypothetical protein